MREIVNLRAAGTDMSSPASGALVGTVTLEMPATRYPCDEPRVLACSDSAHSRDDRIFVLATGAFAYDERMPYVRAEYVEVLPVRVVVDKPGVTDARDTER